MLQLLDGKGLQSKIASLAPRSGMIRLAVAFWGNGAMGSLGLPMKLLDHAQIVCNLRMGGTNSAVIEELMKAGAQVRHSDSLHTK